MALSTPIGVRSSKTIHMNSARMSSHCNVLLATTLPSISVSVRRWKRGDRKGKRGGGREGGEQWAIKEPLVSSLY